MGKKVDAMIGKKFDEWIVIQPAGIRSGAKVYECMCSCGNIRIKAGTELRAGRGKMCQECQYAKLYNNRDEIGNRYGKWVVVEFVDMHRKMRRFKVRCDCGLEKLYALSELKTGKSTQCTTCHNRDVARRNISHGMSRSKVYKVWQSMIHRCTNPTVGHYDRYGGRGIRVAERWLKFENFLEDMGIPEVGLTLDRIDNNGNYEPGNCRWISHKENCQNRDNFEAARKRQVIRLEKKKASGQGIIFFDPK
jgi:hypothetical protein